MDSEKMEVVSVVECAKMLNMTEQKLRKGLQQGVFPFGVAIQTGEKRYTYWVSRPRLERYIRGGDVS